jgi:hypothetical protein
LVANDPPVAGIVDGLNLNHDSRQISCRLAVEEFIREVLHRRSCQAIGLPLALKVAYRGKRYQQRCEHR